MKKCDCKTRILVFRKERVKQNIFEFSSESRVRENEHSAEKSPVHFLVYRDKVRHPSTVKL